MIVRLISVRLRLNQPAAISPTAAADGTLVLPRTPGDDVVILETSLAGSLRSLLGTRANELMGYVDRTIDSRSGVEETKATSSRVRVVGCRLCEYSVVERTSTAVSRQTGSGQVHTLRTNELLPAGAAFVAYLRIDSPDVETDRQDWDYVFERLQSWWPVLGGGATRGWGGCSVESIRTGTLELSRDGDLLTWLTVGGPRLHDDVTREVPSTLAEASVAWKKTVAFTLASELHVGSGRGKPEGQGAEVMQPVRADDDTGEYIIPGSTWKGIFRSRIAEVLGRVGLACGRLVENGDRGGRTCNPDEPCNACEAFGVTFSDPEQLRPDGPAVLGRRGLLRFMDSKISDAQDGVVTHVAIDRFSGGGHDRRLFSERVVTKGNVLLTITADKDPGPATTALLDAVVRDLDEGLVGVGHGTTRGYGNLALSDQTQVPDWDTIRGTLRRNLVEVR